MNNAETIGSVSKQYSNSWQRKMNSTERISIINKQHSNSWKRQINSGSLEQFAASTVDDSLKCATRSLEFHTWQWA
jgi:hypothetical protein